MSNKIKKLISLLLAMCIMGLSGKTIFAAKIDEVKINAEGAIVYCENTGEVVYSKNEKEKLNPLSITKLMTTLLAIQNLSLDQEVTISPDAVKQKGSSMGLKEGEIVTVRDLIYGALLCSGNDAAYALGEAVSGSMENFIGLMNTTAKNIGCKDTHFANVNGLPDKNHYSTAYDMLQITKIALTNDIIKEAAGTDEYDLKATNKNKERTIKSSMTEIKERFPGIYTGEKGYSDDNDCGIAFAYRKAGLNLWVVLLNDTAEGRKSDIEALLKHAEKKIEGKKIISKGKEVGKARIKHGEKTSIPAFTSEIGYAYLPKQASDTLISTKVAMKNNLEAPIKKGDLLGTYQIYVAGELVNEVTLVANENVDIGWFTSYLGISNFAAIIIAVVLLIFAVMVIWLILLKARYKRRKKLLRKQMILQRAQEELRKEQEYRDRGWKF